jgi:trans-2,3-dihydro-3-hydroxyanthranilate isomerase
MRYRYYICDVFTEHAFGGNQLAVVPDARGLSTRQMQSIAREFNFAESTFVLPAEQGHTNRVRIFTPVREMPFAGHPNVGTAFVLAQTGVLGEFGDKLTVQFEEQAGIVPVSIRRLEGGAVFCELVAPQSLSFGKIASAELVAAAASLAPEDIETSVHLPQETSVGLPFLMTQVKNLAALKRACISMPAFETLRAQGVTPDVHLYTQGDAGADFRVRMFAPLDGVPEDAATGSANCALAGLLAHFNAQSDGIFRWRIGQGAEIGRPSVLDVTAKKERGSVVATRVGGTSVMFAEGYLDVEPAADGEDA